MCETDWRMKKQQGSPDQRENRAESEETAPSRFVFKKEQLIPEHCRGERWRTRAADKTCLDIAPACKEREMESREHRQQHQDTLRQNALARREVESLE